ncbi:MAG: hypothetical protein WA952_19265 [Lewinella sp.]
MSRFWKDPQNIIALGVTLISVCALIVSISQTRIMIRQSELMDIQARASVRPILNFERYRSFDPGTNQLIDYRLAVTNSGVGPASVGEVKLEFEGQDISNWFHLFQVVGVPDSIPTYVNNSALAHRVVQVGEEVVILDLSDNVPLARAVYQALDSIRLVIPYESIYGDRFVGRQREAYWENLEVEADE